MSSNDQMQPGEFCWVELCTSDLHKAREFYKGLFGWGEEVNSVPECGDYVMVKVDNNEIGGAFELTEEMRQHSIPPHWGSYVLVEDVDATAKQVAALGGTLLKEPFDVMEYGRMAVLQDPTGAIVSLWQTKGEKGAEAPKKDQPGNVGWYELATTDMQKAAEFYKKLFHWEAATQDMGNGKEYTTFTKNDKPVAGMLKLTEEWKGASSHWGIYFKTTNLDDTLEKAKRLGAHLCYEPLSVPEVGRFTMLKDPQGACFSVIEFAA